MTNDKFILAAAAIVEPPITYHGKSETERSFNKYKEEVKRIAETLRQAAEEFN